MQVRVQIVSILFAAFVLGVVLELVRRRYLRERYALLWLGAALVLLVLAIWKNLLTHISTAVGIKTPSNAFFVIAFAFLLLLLLHFCAVVSRLSDETRVLAQRLALLEQQQRSGASASSPSGDAVEEDPGPAWLTSDHPSAEPTRAGKP
jgi:hypothetical protein